MTDILAGVRVIELAAWTFVPAAGAVLADWGADVIKVEHPETGDPQRGLVSSGIVAGAGSVNHFIEQPNRGKRSIGLNTSSAEGLEVLMKLVETADVFLTNLLPDSRRRMGIDVEQVRARNPEIIYARGHGYGTKGDLAAQGGFDLAAYWSRGASERRMPQATVHIHRFSGRHSAMCTADCRSRRASQVRCSSVNGQVSPRWSTYRCSARRSGSSGPMSSVPASPVRISRDFSWPRCRTRRPACTKRATDVTSRSCCCRRTGSGPTSARGSAERI